MRLAECWESLQAKGTNLPYMDASGHRMQVQRTKTAKIATNFSFIGAIFAVVGFVSALGTGLAGKFDEAL